MTYENYRQTPGHPPGCPCKECKAMTEKPPTECLDGHDFQEFQRCRRCGAPKPAQEPTAEPPTLAALRKMAKRKGCSIMVQCAGSRVVLFTGTDLSVTFDVGVGIPPNSDELRAAVHFYLWSLPDKEKTDD